MASTFIWTFERETYVIRLAALKLLSFSMDSTSGVNYDLILALGTQIFEYLPTTKIQACLGVPAIGLFRINVKKRFSYGNA